MIKRKNLYIFGMALLCLMVAYLPFVQMHFSSDSYANVRGIDTTVHLVNGRLVTYVVQSIFNAFGLSVIKYQSVITCVFICVLGISITLFYGEISKYLGKNIRARIMVFIGSLYIYINAFFAEWFLYVESLTSTSVGIVFLTIAIVLASQSVDTRHIACSFLLLLAVLNMYQLYVEFFLILSLSIVYVKYCGQLNRKSFFHSLVIVCEAGVASIITILSQPLIAQVFGVFVSDRAATFELGKIADNTASIIASQKSIWGKAYGLLPDGVLVVFAILLLTAFLINKLICQRDINGFIYAVLIIISGLVITFAPHIIASVVWMAPRTIPGVFHILTFLVIANGIQSMGNNCDKYLKSTVIAAACILLVLNAYASNGILSNNVATNRIDRTYAMQINSKIEEYEAESGIEVYRIATVNDVSPTYSYGGIKYVTHDMNIRGLVVSWGDVNLINYYCNENYEKVSMPDEIYNTYFEGKNWDLFDLNEQAVFVGDTLYIAMY
ncbi:glucosyltransferase domain-containing protein [Dysosmobacter sp. Sow4_B12]|uniref:glucosyltransferase domain-containing protein n=1 Tax=Dysosmobacter sp. Sow4_B12 TaxID=3438777 RepID=UPI003F8FF80C